MSRTRRTRCAGIVLAVVVLAATVACSSSKSTSAGETAAPETTVPGGDVSVLPTAVSDAPARPSPGCSAPTA
jgi:hypothetical protein